MVKKEEEIPTVKSEDLPQEPTNGEGSFGTPIIKSGILENMPEGYGFLRANGFNGGPGDIYISASQIRRFDIRGGDEVSGSVRPPKENERYYGMLKVDKVNGMEPEKAAKRPRFERLTAVYPNKQLKTETGKLPISTRLIDIVAPIGLGQRGMIVSPPKAGKT